MPKRGEHRPESEQRDACSEKDENTAYAWNDMASVWTQGKGK
jgi:hypothetical protein